MGQYYLVVTLDAGGRATSFIDPHSYGCGAKLCEHARIKSSFVLTVSAALSPEGRFHKSRLVWAGDYADPEVGPQHGADQEEHHQEHEAKNLNAMCRLLDLGAMAEPEAKEVEEYPFVVNHSKRCYVHVGSCRGEVYHPLPMLTADGNGRGGGDVHSGSPLIGAWARDIISCEKSAPLDFSELLYSLKVDQEKDEDEEEEAGAADAAEGGGRKRKHADDPPLSAEARDLHSRLPRLRARLEAVISKRKRTKSKPWVGGGVAQAMMEQSWKDHATALKRAKMVMQYAAKLVGGEAGYVADVAKRSSLTREAKLAALDARSAAKRARLLQSLDADHATKRARIVLDQEMHVTEVTEAYKSRIVACGNNLQALLEEAALGGSMGYLRWVAESRAAMFMSLLRDGRVLEADGVMCVVCRASKCARPGCPRASTYSLPKGGDPGYMSKASAIVSARRREVNGAIALFCAQQGTCPVSLNAMSPEAAAVAMPCKHVFQRDALHAAIAAQESAHKTPTCPLCRADICGVLGYSGEKCNGLKEPVGGDDDNEGAEVEVVM